MADMLTIIEEEQRRRAQAQQDSAPDSPPESNGMLDIIQQEQARRKRTELGTAKDVGITALKGAISVPEAAVGLADIPTGGRVGKFLEEKVGFKPAEAKEILDEQYSEAQKRAFDKVSQAEGFTDSMIEALRNPSTIFHTVGESLPAMGAGGVVARGVGAAAKLAPYITAAIGEGAVGAGLSAEEIRRQTEQGLLTPAQSAAALASGSLTGLLNLIGGRVAKALKLDDIDTLIAGGDRTKISATTKSQFLKGLA